jgi:hypothetical protein
MEEVGLAKPNEANPLLKWLLSGVFGALGILGAWATGLFGTFLPDTSDARCTITQRFEDGLHQTPLKILVFRYDGHGGADVSDQVARLISFDFKLPVWRTCLSHNAIAGRTISGSSYTIDDLTRDASERGADIAIYGSNISEKAVYMRATPLLYRFLGDANPTRLASADARIDLPDDRPTRTIDVAVRQVVLKSLRIYIDAILGPEEQVRPIVPDPQDWRPEFWASNAGKKVNEIATLLAASDLASNERPALNQNEDWFGIIRRAYIRELNMVRRGGLCSSTTDLWLYARALSASPFGARPEAKGLQGQLTAVQSLCRGGVPPDVDWYVRSAP